MSSPYTDIRIPDEVMELIEETYRVHSTTFLKPVPDYPQQAERNRCYREGMKMMVDLLTLHKKQVDEKFKESEVVDA